jgi:Ca2+-binding EF-hand superfamily protein
MRALGFEPKKEEIKKMISESDKDGSGEQSGHFKCYMSNKNMVQSRPHVLHAHCIIVWLRSVMINYV